MESAEKDLSHVVFKLPRLMGSTVLKDSSRETMDGHWEMSFPPQNWTIIRPGVPKGQGIFKHCAVWAYLPQVWLGVSVE